jgi:hypothetical protein
MLTNGNFMVQFEAWLGQGVFVLIHNLARNTYVVCW